MTVGPKHGSHPHGGSSPARAGAPKERAAGAVLLVHGRGASAESILSLAEALDRPGFTYLAPRAAGQTWYPHSFLAPLERNQPGLSSGLRLLAEETAALEELGFPAEGTVLAGFSQGACLALEFVARNPRPWGAVAAFTGGLIGPEGTPREYPGSLADVPIYLGSGDPDRHVPWGRVEESAEVLQRMGARVSARRYPGMGHTIHPEGLEWLRARMDEVASAVSQPKADHPASAVPGGGS